MAFRPLGRLAQAARPHRQGRVRTRQGGAAKAGDRRAFDDGVQGQHAGTTAARRRNTRSPIFAAISTACCGDLEDAVFIFSRDGRLVFASGSVEKFLGRERADLAGQTIERHLPAVDDAGAADRAGVANGPRRSATAACPCDAAAEWRSAVAVVLLSVDTLETLPGGSGTGSGLLVRLRDPEAERKIGRELQTADRLAAISRVSGGVAHEVKNPLNAILLHVEVAKAKLARGDTDVEPQMEIISRRDSAARPRGEDIPRFHQARRVEPGDVRRCTELLGEIVELARPQADAAKIRVNVDTGGGGGRRCGWIAIC